ncbi:hypothetical protein D3C86_1544210 [compost metagenome]
MALRGAMTREAPGHAHVLGLPGQGHLVHPAVTTRAADALGHVDVVVEVDVVRQLGDPVPGERHVLGEALAHRREHGAFGPDLGVAGHARLGRGHPRERRLLDRGVAVPAIDPECPDVVRVAEGHRLSPGHPDPRDVGRLQEGVSAGGDRDRHHHDRHEREACNGVGSSTKELRHAWRLVSCGQDARADARL